VLPKTLIFVFDKGKALLIKGGVQKKWWAGRYNGVGGHIEEGEDALSAARRELKEETALEVSALQLCAVAMVDDSDTTGSVIFMFKADYQGGEIKNSAEGELTWIPLTELENYPLLDDLQELIPRFARMGPDEPALMLVYRMNKGEVLQINYGV
jgi:8-oxo-dGTP diphosphatase